MNQPKQELTFPKGKIHICDIPIEIGKWAIENKLYRHENTFYDFSEAELKKINRRVLRGMPYPVTSGYTFVDPDDEVAFVRLIFGGCTPKWTVWKEKDGTYDYEEC